MCKVMLTAFLIVAACVLPAQTLLVSPPSLEITYSMTTPSLPSYSFTVTSSNGSRAPFLAASKSTTWLSVSPPNGITSSVLTAKINVTGLSPGVFRGEFAVQMLDGPLVIVPVTLRVVALGSQSSGVYFVPVRPCRVADTRGEGFSGDFGAPALNAGTTRNFPIPQSACGIPFNAAAYALNITVVPSSARLSYLTTWPTGNSQPGVSTLNSLDGSVTSNAAIVPVGVNGSISVFVTDRSNVVIDINGYFTSTLSSQSLVFYPITPCRVADTRNGTGPLGGPMVEGGTARDFPILSSPCGIPASALAYSINVTAIPYGPLAFLSMYPTGQPKPSVSTLNSFDGSIKANSAIVPKGASGAISVFVTGRSNVILDINGYFGPPGGVGGLRYYPVQPCRVIDTRTLRLAVRAGASFDVGVPISGCSTPGDAAAYSVNVTALPIGPLTYLTIWPTGNVRPPVSTLNSLEGKIIANAALVRAGLGFAVSVFVTDPSYFVLDVNGYFAP